MTIEVTLRSGEKAVLNREHMTFSAKGRTCRLLFWPMIHDELVIQCPKRFGEQVKALVGDAFKRAAAEVMTQVIMEFEGNIADRWMK